MCHCGEVSSTPAPAEAYAAARDRSARPRLAEFAGTLPFTLDPFQRTACSALEDGHGVLVCAPTGAGKTVVGEFAVHLALAQGLRCFYTTPIKALSNQKYADLVARHGAGAVGLLTGDTSVNGDAQVVVMTTEVLRNMIYARSGQLDRLGYVVMDEVHYLADRFRGAVWEEVILQLPEHVALVSLSATVSNAEEFGDWLVTVRGDTTVVVDEHRPVPLWQHMMVGNRLLDLFALEAGGDGELQVDPELVRATRELDRQSATAVWDRARRTRGAAPTGGSASGRRRGSPCWTGWTATGCSRPSPSSSAARAATPPCQCVRAGLRLTTEDEVAEIRRVVERRTGDLPQADLGVLGYWEWREALERGVAAHHAGMLPAFKETVEELFVRGLVRAVFATETLALGINMPARTVVLERLVKFNGESHAELTPGEYTQLTGRAGRRGIDVEGHAVVVWQPGVDPRAGRRAGLDAHLPAAQLVPARLQHGRQPRRPARRRRRPRPARAVVRAVPGRPVGGRPGPADRAQHRDPRRVRATRCAATSATSPSTPRCAAGSASGRRPCAARGWPTSATPPRTRCARCGPATSSRCRAGAGPVSPSSSTRAWTAATTRGRWCSPKTGGPGGCRPPTSPRPSRRWAGCGCPSTSNHRAPAVRRDLASSLRNTGIVAPTTPRRGRSGKGAPDDDPELATLRRALRAHPCHGCDDREAHARWAERHARLERETEQLRQKVRATTHSLARSFDRIRALLGERGYLSPPTAETVTAAGSGWRGCGASRTCWPPSACATACGTGWSPPSWPRSCPRWSTSRAGTSGRCRGCRPGACRRRWPRRCGCGRIWTPTSAATGSTAPASRTSASPGRCTGGRAGESLAAVLTAAEQNGVELSAGDFVRWCRQVLDLLDQIADVAGRDTPVGRAAAAAAKSVRRGVVAAGTA